MHPTQIKLSPPNDSLAQSLLLIWDDGHKGRITLKSLRDHCPCAGCQGETILLKTYRPPSQPDLPGKYTLTGAQQVGSYAVGISWGDGHSTGIYTFETLRSLCECDICSAKRSFDTQLDKPK